jgi:hypothetical protein
MNRAKPKTLDLRSLSDVERNRTIEKQIVLISVPGVVFAEPGGVVISSPTGRLVPVDEDNYTNTHQWFGSPRFRYATSFDAVLPLLDPFIGLEIIRVLQSGVKKPVLWNVTLDRGAGWAQAETLPLAACVALLRASGIEVLI